MSAAALYRVVADRQPTLLLDEADTYLGNTIAKQHEDLRGLINAGHRRGATVYRGEVSGKTVKVVEFPAFAACALAGIGDLPDTILDRSVIVAMKRRAPDEHVEPFRERLVRPRRRDCSATASQHGPPSTSTRSATPGPRCRDGIIDRAADVWEPLIAVADRAGGDWPERARHAAVALNNARAERDPSLGVQLLADCRRIFAEHDVDRLTTETLVKRSSSSTNHPGATCAASRSTPAGSPDGSASTTSGPATTASTTASARATGSKTSTTHGRATSHPLRMLRMLRHPERETGAEAGRGCCPIRGEPGVRPTQQQRLWPFAHLYPRGRATRATRATERGAVLRPTELSVAAQSGLVLLHSARRRQRRRSWRPVRRPRPRRTTRPHRHARARRGHSVTLLHPCTCGTLIPQQQKNCGCRNTTPNRRARSTSAYQLARAQTRKRDRHRCTRCGSTITLEVHHIVPLSEGGSLTALANLETRCTTCHAKAHNGFLRDDFPHPITGFREKHSNCGMLGAKETRSGASVSANVPA